ncbi:hypothetical protein ACROYT_G014700 [Oculina patagonica]
MYEAKRKALKVSEESLFALAWDMEGYFQLLEMNKRIRTDIDGIVNRIDGPVNESDELRNYKPYAPPVCVLKYKSITDAKLRELKEELRHAMNKSGMTTADEDLKCLRCGGEVTRNTFAQSPAKAKKAKEKKETGRAGRDDVHSNVYILYHGHMKQYIHTKKCRRKELLKHFNISIQEHEVPHLCCDNCALKCKCGLSDCKTVAVFPMTEAGSSEPASVERRIVHADQRKAVDGRLTLYCRCVEIWDKRHALEILSVVSDVLKDINSDIPVLDSTEDDKKYDFDEEILVEWKEFIQDDDLFDMIVDNLSLSQLENTSPELEAECNNSQEAEVPTAVLATVEAMHLDDLQ